MMNFLLALSEDNPCAKMDCASGVLGFVLALVMVGVYHFGKSEGKQ